MANLCDGGNRNGRVGARLKGAALSLVYVLLLLSPVADARQVHASPGFAPAAAAAVQHAPVLHDASGPGADDLVCALCALLGAPLRHDVTPVPTTAWPAAHADLPRQQSALPRTSAPVLAPGSRAPPLA